MQPEKIKVMLQDVSSGKLSVRKAAKRLQQLSFEDLGFAKLDHHRATRTGLPEVIFAPGKTEVQLLKIYETMSRAGSDVIITRAQKSTYDKIKRRFKDARYNKLARVIYKAHKSKTASKIKAIAVVTAGTSDMPVAEEAAVIAEAFGQKVERIYDVGVAGIHRLLAHQGKLRDAAVVIVVAGMEGALASVVSGLVKAPVIAVPTSVGYGASFAGLAALLAMLNSCAPGVTVVNIDNGFGAAMAALKIMRKD